MYPSGPSSAYQIKYSQGDVIYKMELSTRAEGIDTDDGRCKSASTKTPAVD